MKGNLSNTLYVAAFLIFGGTPPVFAEPTVYGPSLDPSSQRPPHDVATERSKRTQSQATWRVINTPTRPAPRDLGFLVFDPNRERLLLFGGSATGIGQPGHYVGVYFSDLWEFDGTDWTQFPTGTPSPRSGLSQPGVYDPIRDRFIISGGWPSSGDLGLQGTWEFETRLDGSMVVTRPSLSGIHHRNFFDTARQRVLNIDNIGRVKEYDGGNWTFISSQNPWGFNRGDFDPMFDVNRGELLSFGGYNFSVPGSPQLAPTQNDLWAWNSATNTWRELTPPSSPPPRARHQAVYHIQRGTHIIFGGAGPTWGSESNMSDVWEYDPVANTWTEIAVTNPTIRSRHAMAYDSINHLVYSFGGRDGNWAHTDELLVLENLPAQPTGDSLQVH